MTTYLMALLNEIENACAAIPLDTLVNGTQAVVCGHHLERLWYMLTSKVICCNLVKYLALKYSSKIFFPAVYLRYFVRPFVCNKSRRVQYPISPQLQ